MSNEQINAEGQATEARNCALGAESPSDSRLATSAPNKPETVAVPVVRLKWALVGCELVRNGLVAEGRKESDDPATCDVAVFNINSAIKEIRDMLRAAGGQHG